MRGSRNLVGRVEGLPMGSTLGLVLHKRVSSTRGLVLHEGARRKLKSPARNHHKKLEGDLYSVEENAGCGIYSRRYYQILQQIK